jgi:uncharacterized protein with HEPN domain
MYKSSIELSKHILREATFILKFTKDVKYENFYEDEKLTRSVIRALEIIGEASKKLSLEFKSNHSHVEWKLLAGLRDRLIHNYEGVDYEVVWETIQNDIPELHFQISEILKNTNES